MAILSVYDKDGNRIDIPAIKGDKGDKGDKGVPGADGRTPVKEVDYFTPEEQAKLVEETVKLVDVPTVTQEEGESEALVMSQKAVTRLVRESVDSIGGVEKIIDFTTTETTVEFQIPIDTDEMVDKLLKASELHLFLYIPRDAEDTETTTTGNVSVGVVSNGGYKAEFAKFEGVIVPPTVTYKTHCRSLAKIFIEPSDSSVEHLAVGIQCKKIANDPNSTSSLYQAIVDPRGFRKGGNFFVTGTQNMAAGTRFVLGVRA